jgi:hypothetical protein
LFTQWQSLQLRVDGDESTSDPVCFLRQQITLGTTLLPSWQLAGPSL